MQISLKSPQGGVFATGSCTSPGRLVAPRRASYKLSAGVSQAVACDWKSASKIRRNVSAHAVAAPPSGDRVDDAPAGEAGRAGLRAVVVGAGIAGLSAARVLADHFDEVLLLDRDRIDQDSAENPDRRGVPQFRQPHGLLLRGAAILEQLLPGLEQEVFALGATPWDAFHNYWLWNNNLVKAEGDASKARKEMQIWGMTRAMLERLVRRRVLQIPGVRVRPATLATGLLWEDNNSRVAGVQLKGGEELSADLVVDASGRSSHVPTWLQAGGYVLREPEVVNSGLVYGTRVYQRSPNWPESRLCVHVGPLPSRLRSAILMPVEDDKWQLILTGRGDCAPTGSEENWQEFINALGTPMVADALKEATPLSAVATYARTENFHRHLEREELPDGLAILGDAACCFNPIYGQGMTMALIGSTTLGDLLGQRWAPLPKEDTSARLAALKGLTKEFQTKLAGEQEFPWTIATSDDLEYLRSVGKAPPQDLSFAGRLIANYFALAAEAAMIDIGANSQLVKATHFLEPPTALFHPTMAVKVLQLAVQKAIANFTNSGREGGAHVALATAGGEPGVGAGAGGGKVKAPGSESPSAPGPVLGK